jgi:hypothetical protein
MSEEKWASEEPQEKWASEDPAKRSRLTNISDFPEVYSGVIKETTGQMGEGVGQLKKAVTGEGDLSAGQRVWEGAKGAYNTAGGALGYATAPLTGLARSMVTQPLEELTGIPKEYPEFALALATPGLGMTKAGTATPPKKIPGMNLNPEVVAASERLGVPVPKAFASESAAVKSGAGALKEAPIIGTPLVNAAKESAAGVETAAQNVSRAYGGGEKMLAGEAARDAMAGWVNGKSQSVAGRLYDAVDNQIGNPAFSRELHSTLDAASKISKERTNARMPDESGAVRYVMNAITDPEGLNYKGLQRLRTRVREMTPDEMAKNGIERREAKRIYEALTEDLRGLVLDSGGPDGLKKFDKANRVYEQIVERKDAIRKIIGVDGDAGGESVVNKIMALAGSKGGADRAKLLEVRKTVGPEAWNEVTSTAINQMGKTAPEAPFSPVKFQTAWNNMPEASRKILFHSTGKTNLVNSIKDIMTLSGAHKEMQAFGSPGSGKLPALMGYAAATWAAPWAAIATATGANVAARILASPATAKQTAKWSVTYSNAMKNPSPGRIAVLGSASDRLANTISKELGVSLSGSDIMKSLGGAQPVRADEGEQ